MFPFELVLYTTQFVNDKNTLLSMRRVCRGLKNHLKTITWQDKDACKITFEPTKILFYKNNKLYQDVLFRSGYYKYQEYTKIGSISCQITSDNFKVKKHIYHTGSVEVTEFDTLTSEKNYRVYYTGLCTIS